MSDDLVATMIERAKEAGDAAGVYLTTAGVLVGPDGPTEPLHLVARYAVGERAFLAPVDVDAITQRRAEDALLERALGVDVAALRREAAEGPLGELERGGA
jgi:hypothetical protein